MDDLFSKAVDVLGPLQSKALSAIDSTLNEYPKPGEERVASMNATSIIRGENGDDLGFAPSALEAAKRVLSYWEEADLEDKKTSWDEQGVTISQNQETSTKNRKLLADQTRAFKSGDKKDVAPLLKAYQGEIDSLTKRAKFAESAYLSIYQLMYDAPDVVPSLRSFVETVDRVSAAEQEARRYRQELEVTRKEAAGAKTLQAVLRRLEERNAVLEEEMEANVAAAVEEQRREAARELEEALERSAAQQAGLEETREHLAALQRLHDRAQSELFDLKTKMEEERASKQHELEMSSEEIERAQERVRSLEHIRMELTAEVERLRQGAVGEGGERQGGSAAQDQSLSDLENSLSSKDKFISTLQEQIQQLESALESEREKQQEALQSLEEALEQERDASEALRAELGMRPSGEQLEELRRHNRVLQELVGTDVNEEWDKTDKDNETEVDSEAARVQRALRETNRRLMAEVTSAKMALAERQTEAEVAEAKATSVEEQNRELQALVGKLEEDIAKGSGMQGRRDGWKDTPSAITGLLLNGSHASDDLASPGGTSGSQEEGTMLDIVCGQRERFRKRVKELEEESGALQDALGKSTAEVKRLQNDNINLYEKIKFLEQYNRQTAQIKRVGGPQGGNDVVVIGGGSSGTKGARYACFGVSGPGGFETPAVVQESQVATSGGTEMRYRKLYEERMNPFNEFHEREQERSYRNLRLHDKITLSSGRFLLSNKYGRMFAFFYTLLLHIFIFFVLYQSSHPRTVFIQPMTNSIAPIDLNQTAIVEPYVGNSTHTFADTIAEKVGTLMQTTRELTNQGSAVRSTGELRGEDGASMSENPMPQFKEEERAVREVAPQFGDKGNLARTGEDGASHSGDKDSFARAAGDATLPIENEESSVKAAGDVALDSRDEGKVVRAAGEGTRTRHVRRRALYTARDVQDEPTTRGSSGH